MPDHLLDWWRVRDEVGWSTAAHHVTGPVRGDRDGFLDVVRATAARDAHRAARLEAALHLAGGTADAGQPLTLDVLTGWQRVVLGVPTVDFRTGPAYAKGGRERYGLEPTTRARFEQCLAEAADPRVPLPARAARVHLDVCFVHPFPDGNGRAALLSMYAVLRREGVVPDQAAPAVTIVRRADDAPGARSFVRLVEVLVGSTRRRASGVPSGTSAFSHG
ncbi:Fic family protein [Cellulomonas xiejunii]|uniref:Fic family protein n=1 Tax=Cellulomonas xiejunii TaxID=2968083 RepID=A0ABY5KPK6_9CELL|nr:Fic family protein [Cellulomonas xiejunii]MCC2313649.1 Fic family protein [Cellulomonas xiejunii]MCC2321139.1 Fic family protein [Cellulomonas xiejunii]UUI71730.1 Fic family protein [Cellulomonas xiejunii]